MRAGGLAAALLVGGGQLGCRPPALPPAVAVTLRGHQDVVIRADGSLQPLVLEGRIGLCLEPPSTTDTSQWVARLSFNGVAATTGAIEPTARIDRVLCFDSELPKDLPSPAEVEICGLIEDRFDQSTFRVPCRTIRYVADHAASGRLNASLLELYRSAAAQEAGELIAALDELSRQAAAAGLPLMSVRLQLMTVYYLATSGAEGARQAAARLDHLPAWLDQDEADAWGAVADYERARLAANAQQPAAAWRLLERGERRARRTAAPRRLLISLLQSELIAEAGALREAIDLLQTALASCATAPCEQSHVVGAKDQLAWFLMTAPDASTGELDEAGQMIAAALAQTPADDALQRANQLINLAFLEARRGREINAPLDEARELLHRSRIATQRRKDLLAWADLVAGFAALANHDAATAQRLCAAIAGSYQDAELGAAAFSCTGRALRLAGRLDKAAEAFETAVAMHLYAGNREHGLRLPLGPCELADDVARAARVAVERGRPEQAWTMLCSLDSAIADVAGRQRCREQISDPAEQARWAEIESETTQLLHDLAGLEGPASAQRSQQLQQVRRAIMEQLRQLAREWPGCAGQATTSPLGSGFRAVALADEVLLLHRSPGQEAALVQRQQLDRATLRQIIDQITSDLDHRAGDARAWRRLVAPLAAALVPEDRSLLTPVTTYALHGLLQAVPVAALPVDNEHWLADLTTVAIRPAGTSGEALAGTGLVASAGTAQPLFIVDPLQNLPSSQLLQRTYRQLLPEANILAGGEATTTALRSNLAGAAWLHFDGHGRCPPAFPELASLAMADGPLMLLELAEMPLPTSLVNLSGCQTGRSQWVAGSGHYGIAGMLARRGVAWVVASRTTLEDRLALVFNQRFYEALTGGLPIPEAYATALAEVRRHHKPVVWANLMLVQGGQSHGGTAPE